VISATQATKARRVFMDVIVPPSAG
jgi:hypothetical protein